MTAVRSACGMVSEHQNSRHLAKLELPASRLNSKRSDF